MGESGKNIMVPKKNHGITIRTYVATWYVRKYCATNDNNIPILKFSIIVEPRIPRMLQLRCI